MYEKRAMRLLNQGAAELVSDLLPEVDEEAEDRVMARQTSFSIGDGGEELDEDF